MSTRSGKRIHATEGSPIVETDVVLQRERKTRSKKQKENIEESGTKKPNYVSYPVDEDASGMCGIPDPHQKMRRTGNTRRSTLNEHNVLIPVSDNVESNKDKSVRKSRRRKTLLKEHENDEDLIYSQNQTQSELAVNGIKRNKKKKNHKKESVDSTNTKIEVIKKKVIKKKRKLRSIINDQADIELGDTSDSFHSAAGSPVQSKFIGIDNQIEEQEIKDDIHTNVTKPATTSKIIINASRKKRKSSTKNSTFEKTEIESDKANVSLSLDKSANVATTAEISTELVTKKKRKFSAKDSSFEKIELQNENEEKLNTTFDKEPDTLTLLNMSIDASFRKRKRSTINNSTIDINKATDLEEVNLNTTCDKITNASTILNSTVDISTRKRRRSSIKNSTFDSDKVDTKAAKVDNYFLDFDHEIAVANGKLIANDTPNTSVKLAVLQETEKLNETYDNNVVSKTSNRKRKSDVINSTYDKIDKILADIEVKDANSTYDKDDIGPQKSANNGSMKVRTSLQRSSISNATKQTQNNTVEILSEDPDTSSKLNSTFNKDNRVLNATFDTKRKSDTLVDSKKSSPASSGATINVTFDNSGENSRISIASDESKTENILNHTPVLIESSIDESMSREKTPVKLKTPVTPLKREGTFTKEASDVVMSPSSKERTPVKRKSSPGRTPFPFSKSSQKENAKLNVTRSIEKSLRRSSLMEVAPRQTRVMFCSPVNNPTVVSQVKGRVIKSNLKGSNKSFVIEDSVPSEARTGRRKRSFTVGAGAAGTAGTAGGETETRAKRTRLGDEMQHSVDRLSRPRTQSAAAKLSSAGTPVEGKPAESKPASRTRLPDFAALHRRQFARMESLDECQRRRARRARALLTPTGSHSLLERISPKGTPPKPPQIKEPNSKLRTPTRPKLPTLDSLIPGYTRFGFKLNVDENPFEVTRTEKTEARKVVRPVGALPSLAGAAGARRTAARQTVMREKSFSEKRDVKRSETRTVIRGVRTNRRFELQMKMRNVNA